MPRIDIDRVPKRLGSGYPAPFDAPCAARTRQRLGDAGGLTDFGVNLMHLPPGNWSSQRHWHSHEDEFVYILEGSLVVEMEGREVEVRQGEALLVPAGVKHRPRCRNNALGLVVETKGLQKQMDPQV